MEDLQAGDYVTIIDPLAVSNGLPERTNGDRVKIITVYISGVYGVVSNKGEAWCVQPEQLGNSLQQKISKNYKI